MIKRIFSSKLFYLIVLFILNISVLICFCKITINQIDSGVDFYPSYESQIKPTTSSRYLIREKNFVVYESYSAEIIDDENIYSTYKLDESFFEIGNEIKENDLLGTFNGNNIYATYDSFCLDIKDSENWIELLTYNYNKFLVKVSLGFYDYYHISFENSDIYIKHDGNYYCLNFVGYDYSCFQSSNLIKADFVPENCNALINSNSECTLEIKKGEYNNQLYVSAELFDYQTFYMSFYVEIDDVFTFVYVECFELIDNCALIQSSDVILKNGMYLYVYE